MIFFAKKSILLVSAFVLILSISMCGPRKSQIMPEGQRIYHTKCRSCHHLIEPEKYSDTDWVMMLEWMGPLAGLEPEEARLMLEYLQEANGELNKNEK